MPAASSSWPPGSPAWFSGPLAGIFLLAILTRRARDLPCVTGAILGWAIAAYLAFGTEIILGSSGKMGRWVVRLRFRSGLFLLWNSPKRYISVAAEALGTVGNSEQSSSRTSKPCDSEFSKRCANGGKTIATLFGLAPELVVFPRFAHRGSFHSLPLFRQLQTACSLDQENPDRALALPQPLLP